MPSDSNYSPYLIIGKLSQDFILTDEGKDLNNIPGGHLLYSMIGMTPWEKHPGLLSRVGNNYPQEFINNLKKYQQNTSGIKVLDTQLEQRNFISYFKAEESEIRNTKNRKSVLTQYFLAGRPYPRDLLGYVPKVNYIDPMYERTPGTILARDIPQAYVEARCIHICPLDYLSHNLLPQAFSGGAKRTITIQTADGYMQPFFFEAIKTLVNGLSAVITKEHQIRSLFSEKFRIKNVEEMLLILLGYGCENVVMMADDRSYFFVNNLDQKIRHLPALEPEEKIKIGELSCFCGAYLVGLNETYDPVKAIAYGAARASMLKNDKNPFNNLDVLDLLLNEKIRIVENMIEG